MDIAEHLIPFGQETCPGWALERKVTKLIMIDDHVEAHQSKLIMIACRLRTRGFKRLKIVEACVGLFRRDNEDKRRLCPRTALLVRCAKK